MQTELLTQILHQTTQNQVQQPDWTGGMKDSGFQSLLDMFSQVFDKGNTLQSDLGTPEQTQSYTSKESILDQESSYRPVELNEQSQTQTDNREADADYSKNHDTQSEQSTYETSTNKQTQAQTQPETQDKAVEQTNDQPQNSDSTQAVNDESKTEQTAKTAESSETEPATQTTEQAENTQASEQTEKTKELEEQTPEAAVEQNVASITQIISQLKELLEAAGQNIKNGQEAISPEMKEQVGELITKMTAELTQMAKAINASENPAETISQVVAQLMATLADKNANPEAIAAEQTLAATAPQAAELAKLAGNAQATEIKTDTPVEPKGQESEQAAQTAKPETTEQVQATSQQPVQNGVETKDIKTDSLLDSAKKVGNGDATDKADKAAKNPAPTEQSAAKETSEANTMPDFLKNLLENLTEKADAKAQAKTQQTIASFEAKQPKADPQVQAQALTVAEHVVSKLVESVTGKNVKAATSELFTSLEQELSKIKQVMETSSFEGKDANMQSDAKGAANTNAQPIAGDTTATRTENSTNFAQTLTNMRSSNGQPVTEQSILNQVTKSMKFSVSDGKMQAKIQLDPPDLGRVMVQINIDGDRLVANMQVESEAAKQIMEKNMDQLRATLAEQGFDVDHCEVNLNEDHSQTGNSNRRPSSRTRTFFKSQNGGDEEQMQTANAGPQVSEHNGQIDYLA